MKRTPWLSALLAVIALLNIGSAEDPTQRIPLPSSKFLTLPSKGRIAAVNSFPSGIVISPDKRYAAALHDGYGTQASGGYQSISVLDLASNRVADFPDQRLPQGAHQTYFLGLAFSSDGMRLYASVASITDPIGQKPGDLGNGIAVYKFANGRITPERFIKIPPQQLADGKKVARALRRVTPGTAIPYPAGLAVVPQKGSDQLLIANNLSDNVVLLDPSDGTVLQRFDLSTNALVPSSFPYAVAVTRDGRRGWCTLWNGSRVAELDLQKGSVVRWIPLLQPSDALAPGSHPTAVALTKDEQLLYVALANADRVAVIATDSGRLIRLLDTMMPAQKFQGTYPDALAFSSDGARLFVADAALNAIAIFDISQIRADSPILDLPVQPALGFVPTEWYPSALASVDGDLVVATAKGRGTGPNNGSSEVKHERRHRKHPYIVTLLYGSIGRLRSGDLEKNLPELMREVEESNLFRSDPGKIQFQNGGNPIRHVIYVLKENRTYDQIFGDLKVGNGDPTLTMYGAEITPNEHKLALQFGVLDNFYDSGEVSGDGHLWSTAAITSDYDEQTWQIAYRGLERIYDFGGTVEEEYPLDLNEPDVNDPATGYLWDNLARHNLTYRDYGEFIEAEWCQLQRQDLPPQIEGTVSAGARWCEKDQIRKGEALPANVGQPHGSASPWPWAVPLFRRMRPTKAALRDHFDPNFPNFNTEYPDQLRADEFLNEFEGFVEARKVGNGTELPSFVLLYLPDDHTHGTAAGKPRPAASVADNDLALGRVVEAVSHSPYWEDTAIFVVEDDAQDGVDHVDAHRSIAFEISKYSPGTSAHPFVDSRFYTTVNMIHTMEMLLGLPPMNQNDAYAPVMAPLFSGDGAKSPFVADRSNERNGLIYQTNPPGRHGAKESAMMDFSRPDAVNSALLNRILWRDRKGAVAMPRPRYTVLPVSHAPEKDKNGD